MKEYELEKAYLKQCKKCGETVLIEIPKFKTAVALQYSAGDLWRDVVEVKDRKMGVRCKKCGRVVFPEFDMLFMITKGKIGKIRVKKCAAEDCDNLFIPVRSDAKYCSDNCRVRAFNKRKQGEFTVKT